ncbi:tRNA glutamyl-Q(34) synthetase GluQRS [Stenotrophomonas sp. MMGLT7]|uniref:tRNA glutamyl-Q(34) synthetase GluQRS n=1 Tax=Stenotrophomonas sp. MMGLT7 TaxID=2901227 RepID=UPI001E2BC537|nr:tRNA glutamyl-Q(34) synthetase GluQRS [Stenotrophomonas sp. MMGLT7]MCD7098724.1 tRNA glutamyl-Q(34) synthetase GluQRS [Stenotrophomonas sp. MMGLT7]
MDTSHYRGRFAPSPTGPLHFGSLLAALGSWLLARHAGGRWLVRIEDVDRGREVAGAARDQLDTLAAFGLHPDEPVLWQSSRGERYRELLQRLLHQGLAFECSCSRSELAAAGGIHHRCVVAAPRPRPAVRLKVAAGAVLAFDDLLRGPQRQDVHAEVGDFVLLRADGCWAYQLAVVADDADQGITHVVRGADLLDSTARQILLQRALGLPTPRYLHLPLVLDADGHKLSKSMAALPLDRGDPLPALALAWKALGQPALPAAGRRTPDAMLHAMLQRFDPARLPRCNIAFASLRGPNL